MIIYFANRRMSILGLASTELMENFTVSDDLKTEDTDVGVSVFECTIHYDPETRAQAEDCTTAGNYILRSDKGDNEFYTIIETEQDTKNQSIYIYAEDAGMDLLNETVGEFEADQAYPAAYYIEKYAADTGFEININEIENLTRKLVWTGEATAAERIASVATEFDNAEISYSFEIKGLEITHKYINIHKKRGKDAGVQLRLNREIDRIVTTTSVADLATALYVTGGTPEDSDDPITLKGDTYDDGDIYVDGELLKSRSALSVWSRYVWAKEPNQVPGQTGHIVKQWSYDTTSQSELRNRAITQLKKVYEPAVNYEIDIQQLPENVGIGDYIDIVDEQGELYLNSRILQLETSACDQKQTATLGEFLIKDSGISQTVRELAEQFEQLAKSRVYYTWIAYADDAQGNGITLDPTGKAYMGTATNRTSPDPDISDPSIYKWSLIMGDGIVEINTYYGTSDNPETLPTEWTTVPKEVLRNEYEWSYTEYIYESGRVEVTSPHIIAYYDYLEVDELDARVANIVNLLAGNAGVGELEAIYLTSANAVIDTAVIAEAVAGTLLADLIYANFIDTNLICVGSEDGSLWIEGSTLWIKDADGNYRIQIGEDGYGDYNLALWDADGNCMWNASGATEYGINDGAIKDIAVADDANISGYKLNIEEICSIINSDGAYEIDAASVTINGQTLDAWYTTITQEIEGLEGLSFEGLMNVEPWFCLWDSDTEAPPDDDDLTPAICGVAVCGVTICGLTHIGTDTQEFAQWVESGDGKSTVTAVFDVGKGASRIISCTVTYGTYFAIDNYTLDGSTVTVEVTALYPHQEMEDYLVVIVEYDGDSLWVDYDIPTADGLYKWVKWKGYYADGHTEWSIPYCLTDGYIHEQTAILQTELEVVQGQILLMVQQTEFDSAIDGLHTELSSLAITVDGIVTQVSDIDLTMDSMDTRMSIIEQTSDSITQSVYNIQQEIDNINFDGVTTFVPYFCIWYSSEEAPPDAATQGFITSFAFSPEETTVTIDATKEGYTPISAEVTMIQGEYLDEFDIKTSVSGNTVTVTIRNTAGFSDDHASMSVDVTYITATTTKEFSETFNTGEPYTQEYTQWIQTNKAGTYTYTFKLDSGPTRIVSCNMTYYGNYYNIVSYSLDGDTATVVVEALNNQELDDMIVLVVAYAAGTYTVEIDVSQPDVAPTRIISCVVGGTYLTITDYTLSGGTAIIEVQATQEATGTISLVVEYAGWVDYDLSAPEGLYEWMRYLLYYDDGHTVWTAPFCVTDEYARTTIQGAYSQITQLADEIQLEVYSLTDLIYSEITMLTDSISLTVTNAALGETAMILLTVNGEEFEQQLDLAKVRQAFASDEEDYVLIEGGTVAFAAGTFEVYSHYFTVDADGVITATKGFIANFEIEENSLHSGKSAFASTSDGVYVGTDGISLGDTFFVAANGNMWINTKQFVLDYDGNATFSGHLSAPSGTIGGFEIGDIAIYNTTSSFDATEGPGIYLGTDGINLGGGRFTVDNYGYLYAWYGLIGIWNITSDGLYSGNKTSWDANANGIYFGNAGISAGLRSTTFSVDINGNLIARSGEIAGWNLKDDGLYYGLNSIALSSTIGIFMGVEGYNQVGSSKTIVRMRNGTVELGYNSSISGYLSGYQMNTDNNTQCLRLAGRGGIFLCGEELAVYRSYPDVSDSITAYLGVNTTVNIVTSITANSSGGIDWEAKTFTFVNGLLNTYS